MKLNNYRIADMFSFHQTCDPGIDFTRCHCDPEKQSGITETLRDCNEHSRINIQNNFDSLQQKLIPTTRIKPYQI